MTNLSARLIVAGMVAMAQSGLAHVHEAVAATAKQLVPARRRRGALHVSEWGYPSGPGWTHAQVKRMAKKRRNQIRHRRNCRKGR